MTIYEIVRQRVNDIAIELEQKLNADVCWYCGGINVDFIKVFPSVIESLALKSDKRDAIAIYLTTGGGSAEVAEQAVGVLRNFYDKVYFVVPEIAMSAGTILCLSGDAVYMRYTSCLGPIDPQVEVNGEYVSANGYLDKVDELISKSRAGTLTPAEMNFLTAQDLGKLAQFEQAANLAKDLVKTWLVQYKFKDWIVHSSTGLAVSQEDKEKRAEKIVEMLGDNKFWHSHGRRIGMKMLSDVLRLRINDLKGDPELDALSCDYHQALSDCMQKHNYGRFFHTKNFF